MRLMLAGILMMLTGYARADVVSLRDGDGERTGTVVAVDDAGVRLQRTGDVLELIPWDRVRSVSFTQPGAIAQAVDGRLERATRIWRARSRLQRGDTLLAEPLFEQLFTPSAERRSETDLIIAEGLLRCRLDRGSLAESIVPALEVARLRRLGVTTDRYDSLLPVMDAVDGTDLSPYLLGGWQATAAAARLLGQLERWDPGDDETMAELATVYGQVLRHPAGGHDLDVDPARDTGHAGAALLRLGLAARHRSPDIRKSAQSELRRRLRQRSSWRDPWLRFYLGTSLLLESGDGRRRQGLVALAGIPARYADEQPYLTGVVLAIMARELSRIGDDAGARRLWAELRQRLPDHPSLAMERGEDMQNSQEIVP